MKHLINLARRLRDIGNRGTAVVEMALTAPLLMIVVIGAGGYGVLAYQQSALVAAARAGAEYARVNLTATGATTTPYAALPTGATLSNPLVLCSCFTPGGSVTPASYPDADHCSTGTKACAVGQATLTYVQVTAVLDPYTPFLNSNLISGNFMGLQKMFMPTRLSATTLLRVN